MFRNQLERGLMMFVMRKLHTLIALDLDGANRRGFVQKIANRLRRLLYEVR